MVKPAETQQHASSLSSCPVTKVMNLHEALLCITAAQCVGCQHNQHALMHCVLPACPLRHSLFPGNGFIQTLLLKAKGQPDAAGQRWWEGV